MILKVIKVIGLVICGLVVLAASLIVLLHVFSTREPEPDLVYVIDQRSPTLERGDLTVLGKALPGWRVEVLSNATPVLESHADLLRALRRMVSALREPGLLPGASIRPGPVYFRLPQPDAKSENYAESKKRLKALIGSEFTGPDRIVAFHSTVVVRGTEDLDGDRGCRQLLGDAIYANENFRGMAVLIDDAAFPRLERCGP